MVGAPNGLPKTVSVLLTPAAVTAHATGTEPTHATAEGIHVPVHCNVQEIKLADSSTVVFPPSGTAEFRRG